MKPTIVEATAPCRVSLAGPPVGAWSLYMSCPGAMTVSVAIDRRPWCRVETGGVAVRLESMDTLEKAEADRVSDLLDGGAFSVVARILLALGIESGVKVTTQAKVPPAFGLEAAPALALAVAAAAARATGRALAPRELGRIVGDAEAQRLGLPAGAMDDHAARLGGVLALHLQPGHPMERLEIDPGRVEECLVLVDSGVPGSGGSSPPDARAAGGPWVRESLATIASCAARMRAALLSARYQDVGPLLAEEWEAHKRLAPGAQTPEVDQIADLAASAGGGARACGSGRGGLVAVWAAPGDRTQGPRERVEASLRARGFRSFPVRVDLRGLAVE
jgi:galactokinase/mevalonate kinase-like predicted kinase